MLAARCNEAERRSGGDTNGLAVAVASCTAEISREIDTDKSCTLRLPRRRLSAEETAAVAAHSRNWRRVPRRRRQIRKPGALADVLFD